MQLETSIKTRSKPENVTVLIYKHAVVKRFTWDYSETSRWIEESKVKQ